MTQRYMVYFEVRSGSKVRFQSVDKAQAIQHAQTVYKAEDVICTIEEIER
jgi:hypothetical protein